MSTAEDYIVKAKYFEDSKQLIIMFDNVTYDGQMDCLLDNNIIDNILTIKLDTIEFSDENISTIDEINSLAFSINRMYMSPNDNNFLLRFYSKSFIQINIIYNENTFPCTTFYFSIGQLYLLEDLNDLILNGNSYYINPKDANDIFIIENNELYLILNSYTFTKSGTINITGIFSINCLLDDSWSNKELMIKGEIPAKVIDYLPDRKFKVYVNNDRNNIKEAVFFFNDGSDIPINNLTPIPNENDSSINLTDVILTEDRLTQRFWSGFYVNQITMLKSQKSLLDTISTSKWEMKGYRGSVKTYASLILEDNKTLVENIISNEYTLELIIKKQSVRGFLGIVEEGNVPNTFETGKLLKVYSSVQGGFDTESNYIYLKLILSEMEVIQDSNVDFTVNDNFYFKLDDQDFDYLVLYILVNGSWINRTFYHVYNGEQRVLQEINTMNVINGIVNNNLLIPRSIESIYNSSKEIVLPTVTFSEDSQTVPITTLKTTNCLGESAQLNIMIQGPIPVRWYDWLPLDKVYIGNDKKVLINPTDSDNYSSLTKIVSVNALPSDDIGIDTSNPSELDLSGIDLETGEPLQNN